VLHHVAIPGGGDGLRCDVLVPAAESGWCRWCSSSCCGTQHEPGLHALLVRTGGSLCPVQTESESSPRARACCSLYYIIILLALEHRHCRSSALTGLACGLRGKLWSGHCLFKPTSHWASLLCFWPVEATRMLVVQGIVQCLRNSTYIDLVYKTMRVTTS
jgi:hypothetical protein